ncbi:hypothetical protein HPB50_015336 [Hyalomma asiaticum]|uniref:Uncharacterized protein n=1 Tax=Hyalomma asiaticum TaxID=266040 RepID=A0ACB7SWH8_HYAAI|nr:hypothetical protein HPB50_015336 [Hyalomma asiaticum]
MLIQFPDPVVDGLVGTPRGRLAEWRRGSPDPRARAPEAVSAQLTWEALGRPLVSPFPGARIVAGAVLAIDLLRDLGLVFSLAPGADCGSVCLDRERARERERDLGRPRASPSGNEKSCLCL